MTIDDARLRAIAERLAATTPGPWRHGSLSSVLTLRPMTDVVVDEVLDAADLPDGLSLEDLEPGCHIVHTFTVAQPYEHVTEHGSDEDRARREWSDWLCRCEHDARFLAHARDDVAALLAEVRRLRGRSDR